MYFDIVEAKGENIEKVVCLERHIGYEALFIATRDPSLIEHIWEVNRRYKDVPLLPILITDDYAVHSDFVGRAILCVEAKNKEEFIKAIRAPYVSLIEINPSDIPKIITPRTINIAKQYYKFIDIPFKQLIYAEPIERFRIFAQMRQIARLLSQKNVRAIISSHASTVYEVISPRQIRAILMEMNFRDKAIKKILKENPLHLFISPLEVTIAKDDVFLDTIFRLHKIIRKTIEDKQ